MQRSCLLIDNEDQTTSIEKILKEAKRKGISLECYQFNVGSTHRDDLLTEGNIDKDKVLKAFKLEFAGKKFDLIAFDWQLDDDYINGIELIRVFNNNKIRRSTAKVLYSGLLNQVVESILDEYKNDKVDANQAWRQINTLIKTNIVDYVDRTGYEKSIVDTLLKIEEPIEAILESKLRDYHYMTFKNTYPQFEGKTLAEIADIIESDVDQGIKFKSELIEQALAYMIEINND